ncbi:hypothetical protein FSP39_002556 [Pinctada imbricata]|uniref:oleoyl-[acyl-carrier-protein] hydrolase n=1 Tax=Pinctada imbricata TaxID=66713 RepID=A0AA88XY23_PINIB|nr:hypothetical protein FSP39_002556 [Pinctada imbricata]
MRFPSLCRNVVIDSPIYISEVSVGSVEEMSVVPDIWLYLQDFVWDDVSVSPELLDNVAFKTSLDSSQKTLRAVGEDICVEDLIRSGSKLSPVTRDGFIVAITSLIGYVDVLRTADVKISGVISNGMSELVAGYVDGCLSKEECMKLACIIGKALEGVSKTEAAYGVYKITSEYPTIEGLVIGPKARILSVHSDKAMIVAFKKKDEAIVLKGIKRGHECDVEELPHHVPLYSDFIKAMVEDLKPQIRKLLPSPKFRSPRMLSSTMDFTYGDHSAADSKFDDVYVTNILSTSMMSNVTKTLPADVLLLDVGLNAERLCLKSSENCPLVFDPMECKPNLTSLLQTLGQIHLHGHTINTARLYNADLPLDVTAPSISPLVSWDHSASYPIPEWPEYYCRVKDEAVCPYMIDSMDLEGIHTPLGFLLYHSLMAHFIQCTCISVTVKDEAVCPYMIDSMDLEGIHTPLGFLLYHSLMAINQKHELKTKMASTELYKLSVNLEPSATLTSLANTVIQVQTGKQYFAAQSEGMVLMSGYYKIAPEEVTVPIIPGYDQDVNQNIYVKEDDSDIQRTEIMWEDSWLDFVDTLLEFSQQWLEGPLSKVYIDPDAHMKTVTDCANLLAVAEPSTGLCKAGSVVLETAVSRSKVKDGQRSEEIGEAGQSKVSMLMAYNIEGGNKGQCKVLIYQGERITDKVQIIGIVLITEEDTICRELPLSMGWRPEDLELLLPYILAVHLLCDVADLKQGKKILICPPIDTVSIYMMALANEIGGSVFTSSYDVEMRQMIDSVFPFVRVLPGEWLSQNIMTLTQGDGCDICIKFTGAGLEDILGLVSINGKVIHCATPTEREVDLGLMREGTSLLIPDLVRAVRRFLEKSTEDIQTMLYSMQNGSVSKLCDEGFPETKGLTYSLEERSHFLDPVSFSLILKVIENPGVNMSMLEGMTESDILAMERIHDVVTSKPKDCSLADSRLGIDSLLNDKENLYDVTNIHNIGQTDFSTYPSTSSTPSGVRILTTTLESPEGDNSVPILKTGEDEPDSAFINMKLKKENLLPKIHVDSPNIPNITVTSPADDSTERNTVMDIPSTSTPMMKGEILDPKLKPHPSLMHVFQARRTSMRKSSLAHLQIPPSISSFKKGVKKLDLLFVGPPPTPITPELRKVLTPKASVEKNIVPLNDKQHGLKLFMIHPITGKIFLLKTLGKLLDMPCYGIQRTTYTPNKSIPCVASHYKNAIEMYQPVGPYYIVGYSFGSVVALEMALQMQEHGAKRACLIMLDGGPMYFHAQFDAAMKDAPKSASENVRKEHLEIGALVTFLQMYTPVTNRDMVLKALTCINSLEERINTVVSMTYGNVVISRNPVRTKWMAAKAKIKEAGLLTPNTEKYSFADAADELIRLKRVQAARDFITSVHILYNYRKEGKKLEGDIYLLRIKDDLPNCEDLPVDYGLHDWCTGKVHIRFYDGTHENFLNEVSGKDVAKEIAKIVADSTK